MIRLKSVLQQNSILSNYKLNKLKGGNGQENSQTQQSIMTMQSQTQPN